MRLATATIAALALVAGTAASAQKGVERWSATSSTAMAITGTILLSPSRLVAARQSFALALAADVKAFGNTPAPVAARILRVTRPSDPPLLNGNRLCGAPVRWIVVWHENTGDLGMAVYSGVQQPTGLDSPGLCGTFLYSRSR